MLNIDRRILNFLIIILLSLLTFSWTFWIFHLPIQWDIILTVIFIRLVSSFLIFKDYSLSWSKVSPKSFLIKSFVYFISFAIYMPLFYREIHTHFFISELFTYLFVINFIMYSYYFFINRSSIQKTKNVVIYGAGMSGSKLLEEFKDSSYKVKYFIDDNKNLQKRSIDGIQIISKNKLKELVNDNKIDLLVIAMPSIYKKRIKEVYNDLHDFFNEIQVLPSLNDILRDKPFLTQLKDVSLEDLLARNPKDLDKEKISLFIEDKTVLITGAGGSIGSELVRKCLEFNAKRLILVDNSEYSLYKIDQEIDSPDIVCLLQSVANKEQLKETFKTYSPDIVIHSAAYKHVPLVETNVKETIINNIIGTKNCIDLSIEFEVDKFILLSTDKAVRPTNVMGTTKRICELYAQNVVSDKTEIVSVRFGNVLGSSGSVIPKFKRQIKEGKNLTVTHSEITRYFMLIPEACELVLQAGAIGKGGEIFILDMGEPIKILDLANKMIELSGVDNIGIDFIGLRPGEKLYEELLINDTDMHTEYDSITVSSKTIYPIEKLNKDIEELLTSNNQLKQLKYIVPEFDHKKNL